jgi:ubiquinone biosynthesis protein
MIREAFQDLNRVRQIAVIAVRHGFADVTERSGIWSRLGRKEAVEQTPEARRESVARRFRTMLQELGPTFIKLGQVLSTRADLMPAAFIDELATLQDQAPPIPLEQVRAQIKAAFGREPEEIYKQITPEPLAAASIAQVHRAITLDGDEVVIKVQRPGIAEQIRSDLSVLHYLARLLEAVVEEGAIYSPTGIIEEFDRAIHEELDFLNEASNVRAFHKNHLHRPYIKIPKVYDELSSRTVLTLELIAGTKLSQAQLDPEGRQTLARHIVDAAFKQLFEDGLFHGDPHPGNLFVLEGPVLALLDFGLVGRLSKQMQDTLVSLVLALALKDAESVARILYRVSIPDSRANLLGFTTDIEGILGAYLPQSLGEISAKRLLRDLLDLAVKYRIRIPKEYAILARAAIATEGILRSLYPEMNITEIALPYAKQLLGERYDPAQLQGGMMKTLLRLQSVANDLPMQLSQILLDLESGKFSVTVKADGMHELNQTLRSLAVVAFSGLCACGFIVGAFISFASASPMMVGGVPAIGLFGVVAASFLFGTALTWYVFGQRVKKLSLKRWFAKH